MIYFPDTILTRYTLTNTGTGAYGEPSPEYIEAGTVVADFQNENNQDIIKSYGLEKQNLYKIYVNCSVEIVGTDLLKDENNNFYEIIGDVQNFKHFHNYKKIHLIKSRKGARIK